MATANTAPLIAVSSPAAPVRRSARTVGKLLLVRLRFPAILVAAFLVIGKWDTLRNYWDTFTRPAANDDSGSRAVSNDTEYFCPMDPGVVSDWSGKCGICNMALVRRKRGEAVALPDGIVARMQLSPYRIQLAGINTAPAAYLPLARELRSAGIAEIEAPTSGEARRVLLRVEHSPRDAWVIHDGQTVAVTCEDLPGHPAFLGTIRGDAVVSVDRASAATTVEVSDPSHEIRAGMILGATVRRAIAEVEPFRSMPSELPPLEKGERRLVYVCPDHPQSLGENAGRCPVDGNALEPQPLAANQRLRWWCPMHPEVVAKRPGERCGACGGMVLRPRVITFRPPGEVLGVPESAVVDTGSRQVVFVERMPGMFEGVLVTLGPRCGDAFPIVSGLEPGERVVTVGGFLLDAETRLNPSLAASYFGAGRASGSNSSVLPAARVAAPQPVSDLDRLPASDRVLATKQATCPVTKKPLGSMGIPVKVAVDGRAVFLCCAGCEDKLRRDPARYLGDGATAAPKGEATHSPKPRP